MRYTVGMFDTQSLSSIVIPPIFLWAIFFIMLVFYLIITIIFLYHWNRYGGKNKVIMLGSTLYLLVSVLLIGTATIALIRIS